MRERIEKVIKQMEDELEYYSEKTDSNNETLSQDYYVGKYNAIRNYYIELKEIVRNED